MTQLMPESGTETIEMLLRRAGRERRCVYVTYRYMAEHGEEHHERRWEPYALRDGALVAFSYFRDEFRVVPLADIVGVTITDDTFHPRRPIEM